MSAPERTPAVDEAAVSDADRAAEHIRRLVDQAPPLTEHQRSRLAVLLRPTAEEAGAA